MSPNHQTPRRRGAAIAAAFGAAGGVLSTMAIDALAVGPSSAGWTTAVIASSAAAALTALAVMRVQSRRLQSLTEAIERHERRHRDLLASVSHNLRTPLTSMLGHLELMLARGADLAPTEQRDYLETAVRNCERLARLVGDLQQLNDLESNRVRPVFERCDLAELVSDCVQELNAEASRRQLSLSASPADQAMRGRRTRPVRADIALLGRTIQRLLEAAMHDAPAGARIGIALDSVPNEVRLTIDWPSIDSVRTDAVELSLSIARRVAQIHGGRLAIDASPTAQRLSVILPMASESAN